MQITSMLICKPRHNLMLVAYKECFLDLGREKVLADHCSSNLLSYNEGLKTVLIKTTILCVRSADGLFKQSLFLM